MATLTPPNRESPKSTSDNGNLNPDGHYADDDGRKLYLLSRARLDDYPAVSLGERPINGRTVSVGVPAGRFAWEQAARFWPPELMAELVTRLEEIANA